VPEASQRIQHRLAEQRKQTPRAGPKSAKGGSI
jgi:hypothetical protein